MLERSNLLIGPFRSGARGRYRSVRDAATQAVLGHVFRSRRLGFGWLTPRSDIIHEEPDGSLLATVRRTWWLAAATVLDADEDIIALIRRRRIAWPDGRIMAAMVFRSRGKGEFRAPAGVELANWSAQADGMRLSFHPRIAEEPLMKMAILGAVLIRC
jgi:hypothetical protein